MFCGRLVRKEDREFDEMVSGMASYYADKKPEARDLQEGGLYAVQEEDFFHRFEYNFYLLNNSLRKSSQ